MSDPQHFVDEELERVASELAAELAADWPERWEPTEHGLEIIGRIVEINPGIETSYGPVPVVVLQGRSNSRRSVWLTHSVLRNAFVRVAPQIGDIVGVKSTGRVERQGADPYENYRVVIERVSSVEPPIDWHAIAVTAAKRDADSRA